MAIFLPPVCCCTRGVGPSHIPSLLFLLCLSVCLVFVLSWGKSFLLVLRLFSDIVALYAVVVFVCL